MKKVINQGLEAASSALKQELLAKLLPTIVLILIAGAT